MKKYAWLVVLWVGLVTPAVWADQDSFTSLVFRPTPGHGPYLNLYDTQVTDPLKFNVEMTLDYARTPFKATVAGVTQSVNKRMITDSFLFDINATKFLQFGFDFPVVFFNQYYDPAAGFAKETQFDLGDPLVMVKGEILDPTEYPIGLAVIPYVTLPLGNGRTFTGTNSVDPGAKLAIEKKWSKVSLALNMGYLFQKDNTRAGIDIDDVFTYGLGTSISLPKSFSLKGELDGQTVAKNFFGSKPQSPAQFVAALRKDFDTGFAVEGGTGVGISRGVGAPLARGFITLSCNENCFHMKSKDRGDKVESDIKVMDDHIETPTIYFEFGKAKLKPEGMSILDRLVDVVKARPKLKGLRIEGHTDTIGGRAANLRLSKDRAAEVKKYLESKSIGIYLESEGYGFDKPVASNKTAEGRAKNRRVEFLIIDK